MVTILSRKVVTTKKDHSCFGCCRLFPVGSELEAYNCAYCGVAYRIYFCETCRKLLEKMESGEEILRGDLREEALEMEAENEAE